MRGRYLAIMVMAIICLCGCDPVRRLSISDSSRIPEGSGVIVARVILSERNMNEGKTRVMMSAKRRSVTGMAAGGFVFSLVPGDNFIVMSLPAGNYDWVEFWVDGKKSDFEGRLTFEVAAGKLAYIGDLEMLLDGSSPWRYGMKLRSRSSAAKSYMHSNYPKLLSEYPLINDLTRDGR